MHNKGTNKPACQQLSVHQPFTAIHFTVHVQSSNNTPKRQMHLHRDNASKPFLSTCAFNLMPHANTHLMAHRHCANSSQNIAYLKTHTHKLCPSTRPGFSSSAKTLSLVSAHSPFLSACAVSKDLRLCNPVQPTTAAAADWHCLLLRLSKLHFLL